MEHKGTQRLETQRLILRRFTPDDAPAAYRNWTSDDRVTKYLRWPTHRDISVTERVLAEWCAEYENPAFYQWTIELRDIGEPIGTISVVEHNDRTEMVHIGYCLGSRWWNMGYMTEAFTAVIRFLFDEVKAQRIESLHDPNNPGSGRVMSKCGMTCEGTLRRADWNNQGIVDACMYSLLADEYR